MEKTVRTYSMHNSTFNKRRSGEASHMTISQFLERSTQMNKHMENILSPLEKKLSSRFYLVEIVGKRQRKVPIILTPDVTSALERLFVKRQETGILQDNSFVFVMPNSLKHIRGHDCLRTFFNEAKLESPLLITSTSLTKYIATVIQVFNLTENETDWVARYLGHDICVH